MEKEFEDFRNSLQNPDHKLIMNLDDPPPPKAQPSKPATPSVQQGARPKLASVKDKVPTPGKVVTKSSNLTLAKRTTTKLDNEVEFRLKLKKPKLNEKEEPRTETKSASPERPSTSPVRETAPPSPAPLSPLSPLPDPETPTYPTLVPI